MKNGVYESSSLQSGNILIRLLQPKDAAALLNLRQENRSFLEAFEPVRPDDYFTLEEQRNEIERGLQGMRNDTEYTFGIFSCTSDETGASNIFGQSVESCASIISGQSLESCVPTIHGQSEESCQSCISGQSAEQSAFDHSSQSAASATSIISATSGQSGELLGRIRLSTVFRGPWQNANLGYFVGHRHNGKGIATAAVKLTARFAFEAAGLHRLQAAVMPWNKASRRVLAKAGFREEGFARNYLQINGKWEDHVLHAMTREDWEEALAD
jgi:RimJ/RimL family protein N-acetyltransferase